MKILFVQKVKALVGSEKYFLELIPELEKRGFQTEFICIYSSQDIDKTLPFIEAYRSLGLKLHVLEIRNEKQILKSVRFIRKIVKQESFDLIHSHLIHADLWCALLKKIYHLNIPIVSTKHGYDEQYIAKYGFDAGFLKKNKYFRIVKYAEKSIHRSYAVSNGLRKLFIDAGICDKDKIKTIHHGFDLPEVSHKINDEFRFAKKQLVVLGRIIPFKGHMHIINALPKIVKEFPDVELLIIGHGDQDLIQEIKYVTAKNGTAQNVAFLGYRPNIYDYLVNSDLMIVPSIAEGFGLIFLEALNAKLPIIGFDVPATNEIIVQGETGFLVPPYNEVLLADAVINILKDESVRTRLADNGYLRLKEYFSLERMTTETIQFYQAALSSYRNTNT